MYRYSHVSAEVNVWFGEGAGRRAYHGPRIAWALPVAGRISSQRARILFRVHSVTRGKQPAAALGSQPREGCRKHLSCVLSSSRNQGSNALSGLDKREEEGSDCNGYSLFSSRRVQ